MVAPAIEYVVALKPVGVCRYYMYISSHIWVLLVTKFLAFHSFIMGRLVKVTVIRIMSRT
jgi:hypothetical protein